MRPFLGAARASLGLVIFAAARASGQLTCDAADAFVGDQSGTATCLQVPQGCDDSQLIVSGARLAHNNLDGLGCGRNDKGPSATAAITKCSNTPSLVCGCDSTGAPVSSATGVDHLDHTKVGQVTQGECPDSLSYSTGVNNVGHDTDTTNPDNRDFFPTKRIAAGFADSDCYKGIRYNKIYSTNVPNIAERLDLPYLCPDETPRVNTYTDADTCDTACTGTCYQAEDIDVKIINTTPIPANVPNWNAVGGSTSDVKTFIEINVDGPGHTGEMTTTESLDFMPPDSTTTTLGDAPSDAAYAGFKLDFVLHNTDIKYELDFVQVSFFDFDTDASYKGKEGLCVKLEDIGMDNPATKGRGYWKGSSLNYHSSSDYCRSGEAYFEATLWGTGKDNPANVNDMDRTPLDDGLGPGTDGGGDNTNRVTKRKDKSVSIYQLHSDGLEFGFSVRGNSARAATS